MADAPQPLTGHCLCGSMRYTADAAPLAQAVCHCTECQRQTSSPFSVVVAVPKDAFSLSGDTLASFETDAEDGEGKTERNFCSACGSPLFSLSSAMPQLVFIKAGSLDDSSWLEPTLEVWMRSAQDWSPRFEGTAQMERGAG